MTRDCSWITKYERRVGGSWVFSLKKMSESGRHFKKGLKTTGLILGVCQINGREADEIKEISFKLCTSLVFWV